MLSSGDDSLTVPLAMPLLMDSFPLKISVQKAAPRSLLAGCARDAANHAQLCLYFRLQEAVSTQTGMLTPFVLPKAAAGHDDNFVLAKLS